MSKVITFSQKFPSYHPETGKPTHFVEKILIGLGVDFRTESYFNKLLKLNEKNLSKGVLIRMDIRVFINNLNPTSFLFAKFHTIRNGNRFKAGEMFSPRVWSDVPYYSPQIIFWDDLEVIYCPEFEQDKNNDWIVNEHKLSLIGRHNIAASDGLKYLDMVDWFPQPFRGQVICWKDLIDYQNPAQ